MLVYKKPQQNNRSYSSLAGQVINLILNDKFSLGPGLGILSFAHSLFALSLKIAQIKERRERFTNSLQTSDKLEKIVFSYLLDSSFLCPSANHSRHFLLNRSFLKKRSKVQFAKRKQVNHSFALLLTKNERFARKT